MGGLLHLVQRGGTGQSRSLPRPFLAVPNVTATAHALTASVPITVLLYNGPLYSNTLIDTLAVDAWAVAVTFGILLMDRCSAVLMCPSKR